MGINLDFNFCVEKGVLKKEILQIYAKVDNVSAIEDEINYMNYIDISSSSLNIFGVI